MPRKRVRKEWKALATLAAIGVGVYFVFIRKSKAAPPGVPVPPPALPEPPMSPLPKELLTPGTDEWWAAQADDLFPSEKPDEELSINDVPVDFEFWVKHSFHIDENVFKTKNQTEQENIIVNRYMDDNIRLEYEKVRAQGRFVDPRTGYHYVLIQPGNWVLEV
jgi:hypothetical protein